MAVELLYDIDDLDGSGEVLAYKRNGKTVKIQGHEEQTSYGLGRNVMPGMYKIGTLTTETTPVYNVTTEDMSEAYRTVTTVTYYSDGTSKTSSTTQKYVDVYGTPTRNTSVLADESEWEVNYTYRINQYYAELFDEDGDGNLSNNKVWLSRTEYLLGSNLYYRDEIDIENLTVIFE